VSAPWSRAEWHGSGAQYDPEAASPVPDAASLGHEGDLSVPTSASRSYDCRGGILTATRSRSLASGRGEAPRGAFYDVESQEPTASANVLRAVAPPPPETSRAGRAHAPARHRPAGRRASRARDGVRRDGTLRCLSTGRRWCPRRTRARHGRAMTRPLRAGEPEDSPGGRARPRVYSSWLPHGPPSSCEGEPHMPDAR
jgi:hypothetical protein